MVTEMNVKNVSKTFKRNIKKNQVLKKNKKNMIKIDMNC